jgi:hypothetical protein
MMTEATPAKPEVTETVPDQVADNPNPEIVADPAPAADPAPTPEAGAEPPPKSAAEIRGEKLNAIAKRLRGESPKDAGEFTGDFSDPGQQAGVFDKPAAEFDLTPEFIKQQGGDAPAADKPAADKPAPSTPKTFKLRVDGQEYERSIADVAALADMTVEEVEANPDRATRYAQKEIASDRRLDAAKEIYRGAKDKAATPHQDGDPNDPNQPSEPRTPDQENPIKKLIEDIQFGADPEAVADQFDRIITQRAAQVGRHASLEDRTRADFEHTMSVFNDVKSKNEALFADPYAEAAMQRILYDGYREDLRAAGFAEDQIPADNAKLIDSHRIARVTGRQVRSAEKLIGDVKDKYVAWRDGTPEPKPSPAPLQGQPRVVVDREARRQAIPSQPSPANAPPRVPAAPQAKKTREQVLNEMRKSRGKVVAA